MTMNQHYNRILLRTVRVLVPFRAGLLCGAVLVLTNLLLNWPYDEDEAHVNVREFFKVLCVYLIYLPTLFPMVGVYMIKD